MAKPDRVYDLERRQKCLEDEITKALSCYPSDDPMIGDLKRRLLHLRQRARSSAPSGCRARLPALMIVAQIAFTVLVTAC